MKKQVINDGFKMWANYLEAVDNFTKNDDAKFGRFMRIICYYGIYGEEIAENEVEQLFFTGIKSSINASIQNIKNGKTGGRGKTSEETINTTFKKPTLEEIKAYCEERNNGIDPNEFLDHYTRNHWTYGKDSKPVKDWKACVRIWERNNKKWESERGTDVLHSTNGESL